MATGPSESQVPQSGARLSHGSREKASAKVPSRDIRKAGKEKQAARIAALEAELQRVQDLDLVPRAAAISAACSAASHTALLSNATAEEALRCATAVHSALASLASPALACTAGHPGAEAVASAANGLGSLGLEVAFPGSEAVASEADGLGNGASELDFSDKLSTTVPFFDAKLDMGEPFHKSATTPEWFDICDAAPILSAHEGTDSGDAAAGSMATCHPAHRSHTLETGEGPPLTTLAASAGASQPVGNDDDKCGPLPTAVMRIPGSSSPGSQDDAHDNFYNDYKNIVVGDRLHETAKTALPEQQCGQVATANFGHEPVHELLSCRDMSLKPFNSQNLANTCVDQCGPLPVAACQQCEPSPLNASPRAFEASSKSDFNSQNLAIEHVPPLSETAGRLQNSPASPRAAFAISENGHGLAQCDSLPLNTSPRAFDVSSKDSISQSLADPQVAKHDVEKLKVSEVLDVVTRALPQGLPDTTTQRVQEYFQKFATSDFYASVDACHRNEVLLHTLDMVLSDYSKS